ncbi:MAG: radical SAM protein [archaeon]
MIKEINCKSALYKIKSEWLPYKYDLNIYRGCLHNCKYCFAKYSHKYLDNTTETEFFNDIFVKKNIAEVLDKELSSLKWQGEVINLGGVTDCYQPLEAEYKLMPKVLDILIKHKQPISICTKSNLILRDFEKIKKLAEVANVSIATTITTTNENLRKQIEPAASPSSERFNFLKEFKTKTNVKEIGILQMPILPYLTDNQKDLQEIYKTAKEIGVDFIFSAILNLRGETKINYLKFIKEDFPDLYIQYLKLYRNNMHASKEYREKTYSMVKEIREKYDI